MPSYVHLLGLYADHFCLRLHPRSSRRRRLIRASSKLRLHALRSAKGDTRIRRNEDMLYLDAQSARRVAAGLRFRWRSKGSPRPDGRSTLAFILTGFRQIGPKWDRTRL